MRFDKNQNIEELLNGFVDGELSAKEAEEVQQLVEKDLSIARRLHEIETCRLLVSSLPPAEPPAKVVSGIKELVRGNWSQGVRVGYSHSSVSGSLKLSRGRLFLLSRQLIAASVVIGLLGVLAGVIYRIITPETTITRTVADSTGSPRAVQPENEPTTQNVKQGNQNAEAVGIYSLNLTTADFAGVDSFINKVLGESTLLQYRTTKQLPGRSVYRVYCSRAALEDLMTSLTPVWSRFDSATLLVNSNNAENQVAVEQIRPEQVTDIAKQKTNTEQMRMARDFAVSNDIRRLLPQERMMALGKNPGQAGAELELPAIPKPVLTSGDRNLLTAPRGAADQVQVELNIVLSSRE
jgi:hypothetical protein